MIYFIIHNTIPTSKERTFENIVRKGENAVTSIFFFSDNVSYL